MAAPRPGKPRETVLGVFVFMWFRPCFRASLLLLAGLWSCGPRQADPFDRVLDLQGNRVDPLARNGSGGTQIAVFLFMAGECPISNRYAPEIQRIARSFQDRPVRFWSVYPDPDEAPETIAGHQKEFGYSFGVLRDTGHQLVERCRARVTPEAAVFVLGADGAATLFYHGRIDDRYADFGLARAEAVEHDLERAIQAALAGQPAPQLATTAIGCFIPRLP